MKRKNIFIVCIILLAVTSLTQAQRIFRPMDPIDPWTRYGKSPYSSPPFFFFGTTSYSYKIANSQYNAYLSDVDAAFASWNSAAPVQFSRTSTGLVLSALANNYDTWGPAWSYPSWSASTYELTPESGSIVLNTNATWSNSAQNLNASPPLLDVQTMVVHEAGHIHGLAHPLTNSYTHDATAPTMAGGDNAYFNNTLDVRSLETEDIYGTQFLQLRVPTLYSNLLTALNTAAQIGTGYVYIVSNHTLSSNVNVVSGVALTIKSSTTVNLNGFSIKSTGGTITIESGVTQNYVELKDGSTIKGLYSSLNTAVSDAVAGQTINVYSSSLIANVSIPSGITVNIKSSSTLNLNGYKLLLAGGSVVVESGANFPYAKLKNNYSTLLGYYPTIESAINDAISGYTVELPSITYNGNISLTNKGGVKLKGAGVGSTTINGNITITNSTYAQVSDFTMGNYKSITVNGGDRPYVYNIGFNNTGYNYIFVYDGYNTDLSGINNVGASTSPAWRFYNSYTGNIRESSIEGYDFGIQAASYSEITMSGMSFCSNMIDLWASSGCWIYATHSSLSYTGAYTGNCTFGLMFDPCGSKAERRDDSQLAKNAVEQFDSFNEANSAFRALLMDENISKASKLTENSKNKINGVVEQYKSILGTNISKNEIKEALSKLSVCNRMLDEENGFVDYVTDLISNKKVPSEMKRFLIPNLVSKGNYNQAINLIDEISAYQDVSDDLKYELLYEKGTIQKYYLNEADQSEKVFAELYKNGGDHILARYAKAQLNNESSLDDGSNPKTGDNSEVDNGFAISSYPNPFNPTATIEYQIPKDGLVNLVVYNTLGQVVAELVNEHQSVGKYSVQFNASNLPSGIYFYKIESGSFSKSMKMLLLK